MENYEQIDNERLERAKQELKKHQNECNAFAIHQVIYDIFPELKDIEDDRIRKAQLDYWRSVGGKEWYGVPVQETIAWLEKQKPLNNFDEAEKEKNDFVSGQFIECRKSFNEFEEEKSYWLEYIGDDTYIGRSDNVLNQKFHITPRQLFTLFTHEHCPKENNWNNMVKNLDKIEEYILSLVPNMPLDTAKVHAKNIRFLVNEDQKSADEVKPKFKVGCWIINNDKRIAIPTQILEIEKYGYVTSRGYTSFDKVKTDYHLWTIQDAKDGDVLVYEDEIFMLKSFALWHKIIYHCCYDDRLHVHSIYESLKKEDFEKIVPATKEQRDLLFSKMKEAGYEWDAEKKELRKIEQKHTEWSEDDDWMLNVCCNAVDAYREPVDKLIVKHWLNSLKDRIIPQQNQEWSEEDEQMLESCIDKMSMTAPNLWKKEIYWLKSLKPQKHWKPSDEQLNEVKNAIGVTGTNGIVLLSLYNDLKNFKL